MKFTLNWLKDHLDTDASLQEITDKLTAIGLELEGVEDPTEKFAPFKVAYVESAKQHPDADRLRVCIVDTGEEKVQVVCGAPNAHTGMKGVFAPAGSYVPGTDLLLKKGKIRGQESNGMLVSEREMGLSDEHDGIIDLPEDTPIGTPFTEIFGMDDPVIDIALTPDRGDCAGVRGIARDLAAAGLGTLKPLKKEPHKGTFKSSIDVKILDTKGCPLFTGCLVKNVENKPSPTWMQNRLKAVGLRPISALVDITNYVSLDLCRPLHVYDADLVKGDIHVREAKAGEKFDALNDRSYELKDGMTAIADDSGVLGLGGIVGGVSTGSTEGTKNVFIECALFDPNTTAKTGRNLQVDSDARYRFDRGVDPEFVQEGIEHAAALVMELCGGEPSEIVVAGAVPTWKKEIEFDPAYTLKLAGIDVPADKQTKILKDLGFEINGNKVTPPSWRNDVEGKADLVEEVVRIVGYDQIEAISVRAVNTVHDSAETVGISRARMARSALSSRGMSECVTYSFMPKELAKQFGSNDNGNEDSLTLNNAISEDLEQMRPSILPNLISAALKNADHGISNTALFEVGPDFQSSKVDGERNVAAGIRYGSTGNRHWSGAEASKDIDVFSAKADAIAALEAAGAPTDNLQVTRDTPGHYHPGRSGALVLGRNVLATFGEIHPAILEEMSVKNALAGFEVFLDNIPVSKKKGTAKPLLNIPSFLPVERDFAFTVDENVEADTLVRAAKGADKNLIVRVDVFDIYQGKGVDEGKKSVAVNVVLQPIKQTLTDSEIEGVSKKIIDAVAAKTGATLRG
ncbi:MAG: phenylalanine--tRNA ligase subunit beta [Micavibrio sp.]|nr:phenylalanine--tRNA ligase subunit beta [Micavibrio sp.]